jgi:hypothetical protein
MRKKLNPSRRAKMSKEPTQFRTELELCLIEQGIHWYQGELNLIALAVIGLSEVHKKDLDNIEFEGKSLVESKEVSK